MKNTRVFMLGVIISLLFSHAALALKVACVGDSHTFKGGLSTPDVSYPAQLETILKLSDNTWETRNFGVSGATVLEQGNIPYIHQTELSFPWKWYIDPNAYELALAWEPDVVVFQFGSNATMNLKNIALIDEHFVSDYNALIQTFADLPSKPKIVICLPPPMFNPMYSPCATILKEQIVPLVAEVAATWNAPVVDFYTAFLDLKHLYEADQMEITAAGEKIMADMVAEAILSGPTIPDFNGDGVVDTLDMHIMVDNWGRSDSACDIAPEPSGDGIVDLQDFLLLTDYLDLEGVDSRLISHWKLNEETWGIAYECISHNDGILYGKPTWEPGGGMIDGALKFDGMDDYVGTPFVLDPESGPFSILAWVKGGIPGQVIISQGSCSDWLLLDGQGHLMTDLAAKPGREAVAPLISGTAITDGLWHHIVLTSDGSHRSLYVDGVEIIADDVPSIVSSEMGLSIGAGKGLEPDSFFTGMMDDIRIYNVALEPNEIAEFVK